MAVLWRLVFGVLVLGALRAIARLAWRWGPPAAVYGLGVVVWPSVAVAWALRRRALPAAEARWPGWRPGWWLAGAGALLVAGIAFASALGAPAWAQPRALAAGYLAGVWLAPLAVPAGVLPVPLVALYVLAAVPLFLALGVVLAAGWPLYGRVVRVCHRGGRGGSDPANGKRQTPHQGSPTLAPGVRLRPVSAQRIATATYAETRFFTRALDGPELLTMLVGPAGVGKSEVLLGSIRIGHDGEAFCGLETSRSRRILLLSEMGAATLQPALLRWGFVVEPRPGKWGRLDAVRLRWFLPEDSAGALLDVLYAAEVYAPRVVDGELRQTEWPAVVQAAGELCARRGYDRVIVDSLGEWMGSDNNDAMLTTLGACRQLTHAGVGVTILHHTPRSDPKRPRGGTVIEAKLDVGYSVTGIGPGGAPGSRSDPVRRLEWFKTRFPDQTPEAPLLIERVWAGPRSGERPRYRLVGDRTRGQGDAPRAVVTGLPRAVESPRPPTSAAPEPALAPNEAVVLAALREGPPTGMTMKALAEATDVPRNRVSEAVTALVARSRARVGGYAPAPGGGPKASLYVAVGARHGAQERWDPPHLRLVAPGPAAETEPDGAGADVVPRSGGPEGSA